MQPFGLGRPLREGGTQLGLQCPLFAPKVFSLARELGLQSFPLAHSLGLVGMHLRLQLAVDFLVRARVLLKLLAHARCGDARPLVTITCRAQLRACLGRLLSQPSHRCRSSRVGPRDLVRCPSPLGCPNRLGGRRLLRGPFALRGRLRLCTVELGTELVHRLLQARLALRRAGQPRLHLSERFLGHLGAFRQHLELHLRRRIVRRRHLGRRSMLLSQRVRSLLGTSCLRRREAHLLRGHLPRRLLTPGRLPLLFAPKLRLALRRLESNALVLLSTPLHLSPQASFTFARRLVPLTNLALGLFTLLDLAPRTPRLPLDAPRRLRLDLADGGARGPFDRRDYAAHVRGGSWSREQASVARHDRCVQRRQGTQWRKGTPVGRAVPGQRRRQHRRRCSHLLQGGLGGHFGLGRLNLNLEIARGGLAESRLLGLNGCSFRTHLGPLGRQVHLHVVTLGAHLGPLRRQVKGLVGLPVDRRRRRRAQRARAPRLGGERLRKAGVVGVAAEAAADEEAATRACLSRRLGGDLGDAPTDLLIGGARREDGLERRELYHGGRIGPEHWTHGRTRRRGDAHWAAAREPALELLPLVRVAICSEHRLTE